MSDPINALEGLFARVRQGPMHRFTISQKGDFSIAEAEQILREYHIPVWGREADKEEGGFAVKQAQAAFAEYLLCRAGVPITSQLLKPEKHAGLLAKHGHTMPETWSAPMRPHSIIAKIVDGMSPPRRPDRERRKRRKR